MPRMTYIMGRCCLYSGVDEVPEEPSQDALPGA
jgi:hypothetical protein